MSTIYKLLKAQPVVPKAQSVATTTWFTSTTEGKGAGSNILHKMDLLLIYIANNSHTLNIYLYVVIHICNLLDQAENSLL